MPAPLALSGEAQLWGSSLGSAVYCSWRKEYNAGRVTGHWQAAERDRKVTQAWCGVKGRSASSTGRGVASGEVRCTWARKMDFPVETRGSHRMVLIGDHLTRMIAHKRE